MNGGITMQEASEFLWHEAHLLDRRDYAAWLDLWSDDGLYIVPIDASDGDYANRLNYIYDNAAMRRMRVARLESSFSMSALTAAKTVRTTSRFVANESRDGELDLTAAQVLVEYRRDRTQTLGADLDVTLRRSSNGLCVAKKVVRLVNSEDAVNAVGYLL
jgi:3-phenylpropionate/cinnamic acid dioxygenase small subunit